MPSQRRNNNCIILDSAGRSIHVTRYGSLKKTQKSKKIEGWQKQKKNNEIEPNSRIQTNEF